MLTSGVLPLLLILAGAAVWWSNLHAREIALAQGWRVCRSRGLQFLDETVAFQRYGLGRDRTGRLRLQRVYGFEFSALGEERGRGWIRMLGPRVESVHLEQPDGTVEHEERRDDPADR